MAGGLSRREFDHRSEESDQGPTSSSAQTASGSVQKPATLETGVEVRVPAFIKQGDIISVDTATGAYRERKKD